MKPDFCWDNGKNLREYVCNDLIYEGDHTYECPYGCSDGACDQSPLIRETISDFEYIDESIEECIFTNSEDCIRNAALYENVDWEYFVIPINYKTYAVVEKSFSKINRLPVLQSLLISYPEINMDNFESFEIYGNKVLSYDYGFGTIVAWESNNDLIIIDFQKGTPSNSNDLLSTYLAKYPSTITEDTYCYDGNCLNPECVKHSDCNFDNWEECDAGKCVKTIFEPTGITSYDNTIMLRDISLEKGVRSLDILTGDGDKFTRYGSENSGRTMIIANFNEMNFDSIWNQNILFSNTKTKKTTILSVFELNKYDGVTLHDSTGKTWENLKEGDIINVTTGIVEIVSLFKFGENSVEFRLKDGDNGRIYTTDGKDIVISEGGSLPSEEYEIAINKPDGITSIYYFGWENGNVKLLNIEDLTCSDSDGGKNYKVLGKTYSCLDNECMIPVLDTCRDLTIHGITKENLLSEQYCDSENRLQTDFTDCGLGNCENGVCVGGQDIDLAVTSVKKGNFHEYGFYITVCNNGTDSLKDIGFEGFPVKYVLNPGTLSEIVGDLSASGSPEYIKNGECSTYGWTISQKDQNIYDTTSKFKVYVDYDKEIIELSENNNEFTYYKIECPIPDCVGSYKTGEIDENGCPKWACGGICAKEGEMSTSASLGPEGISCCPGLDGFNTRPGMDGIGSLCYDSSKGTPTCSAIGSKSQGWYYPNGDLLKWDGECNSVVKCKTYLTIPEWCDDGVRLPTTYDEYGCPNAPVCDRS